MPADATILEVGLGGRYDATNVIPRPRLTAITPVAFDHQEFLGNDLSRIAWEKAGILKRGVPVIVGPQSEEAREVIVSEADRIGAPVAVFGQDYSAHEERGRLVYQDEDGLLDLPLPRLPGRHQFGNAAIAIAALRKVGGVGTMDAAIEQGLRNVEWPARMQRLHRGPLVDAAPRGAEVWLDGGHNPHCAAAVAQAFADLEERAPKPLYLISGMLKTKDSFGFLAAFRGLARHVSTVAIPGEEATQGAGALYDAAREAGLDASPAEDMIDAMLQIAAYSRARDEGPPRILVCGSLYLAGKVLADNG